MPRLPYSLLHRARQIDSLLVPLLRVCRDLPSARNELRWLTQHVTSSSHGLFPSHTHSYKNIWFRHALGRLCEARGRGVPLQYLLGTEYFGDLELFVRRGVLIPRRETASAICHLSRLLNTNSAAVTQSLERHDTSHKSTLKVLDLCSGTGCIPLLLQQQLEVPSVAIGVDINAKAVALGHQNAVHTARMRRMQSCRFARADIMSSSEDKTDKKHKVPSLRHVLGTFSLHDADIVVSNPPYISPDHYLRFTERSVRNYEPRLALVPEVSQPAQTLTRANSASADELVGDAFYPRLLESASSLLRPRIFWCEVADLDQARRVAAMALGRRGDWDGVEIWRDEPSEGSIEAINIDGHDINAVGHGHGRSVLCWRGEGASWLGKDRE